MVKKMSVDIWSDVRCPFCYIGKRKFETGLESFPGKDKIEVNWHSFQLDPDLVTQPGINVHDYFAERKGVTREQSLKMHEQVTHTAKEAGLEFNFEKAVMANSFNAHRLIQYAKANGKGDEAEEQLFKAYFTDGKNIDDPETLIGIGASIGFEPEKIGEMLSSSAFEAAVREDELQAQHIGIRGVPFFIFNNRYAVSGAQAPGTFLAALEKSFGEFEKEGEIVIADGGETCTTDGKCS
jgi:predicted DsbA family dithiol-disulfide isomerase